MSIAVEQIKALIEKRIAMHSVNFRAEQRRYRKLCKDPKNIAAFIPFEQILANELQSLLNEINELKDE